MGKNGGFWYSTDNFYWDPDRQSFTGFEITISTFDNYLSPFPSKGKRFYMRNPETGNFRRFILKCQNEDVYTYRADIDEGEDEIMCFIYKGNYFPFV